jgi:hypothetical protein
MHSLSTLRVLSKLPLLQYQQLISQIPKKEIKVETTLPSQV